MTENNQKPSIDAQPGESAGDYVDKGGRRSNAYYKVPAQQVVNLTASRAARILQDFINRRAGKLSLAPGLQKACEYIIDHAIGKARMKPDLAGGHMSYKELMDSADKLDDKPRPILADVEEIANKTTVGPGDSV